MAEFQYTLGICFKVSIIVFIYVFFFGSIQPVSCLCDSILRAMVCDTSKLSCATFNIKIVRFGCCVYRNMEITLKKSYKHSTPNNTRVQQKLVMNTLAESD